MLRALRATAASLLAFAIVVGATGWLYLIRPDSGLPGPPLPDALPLDELSKHSAVPLLVFLAVWGTAALLLGLAEAIDLGRLREPVLEAAQEDAVLRQRPTPPL